MNSLGTTHMAEHATRQDGPGCDDPSGFEEEAIPYMRRLYPAAYRLTRNHCDAEDLIQDTFAKAYLAYDQYSQGTNLKAWLNRILVTTFYSSCRKRDREPVQVLAADVREAPDCHDRLTRCSRSAELEALDNLADSGAMKALGNLPDSFKAAVYLADVQGYRYSEIADIMGTPIGTVMSRIHRGRQMLRTKLRGDAASDRPTQLTATAGRPCVAAPGSASAVVAALPGSRRTRPSLVRSPRPLRGPGKDPATEPGPRPIPPPTGLRLPPRVFLLALASRRPTRPDRTWRSPRARRR